MNLGLREAQSDRAHPRKWDYKCHSSGGPIRTHLRSGFRVGGNGESPDSIVTLRGFETWPPLDPRSSNSPGCAGISPGFCPAMFYSIWMHYV